MGGILPKPNLLGLLMANQTRPVAVLLDGKIQNANIKNVVGQGSDGVRLGATADVDNLKIEGVFIVEDPDSLLAQLNFASAVDRGRLADVIERTVNDPEKSLSDEDRGWLSRVVENAANLTATVQGVISIASSPMAKAIIETLRKSTGL